jgi:hypothetical protein
MKFSSFEGKYPKDLFNKSVYADDNQVLIGYVAKETDDLIVVFSECNKNLRFDIPKSEIAVAGSSVIIQNSQSVLSRYKEKKGSAFPEGKTLKPAMRAKEIERRQEEKTLEAKVIERTGETEPIKRLTLLVAIMRNTLRTTCHIFKSKKNHFNILSHFQSRKSNKDMAKSSRSNVRTWVEGINNESNLWLKAVILNDKGNFIDAILLYLEDAKYQLKEGLMTHAGLSCSCAADCMTRIGHLEEARRLYAEAAKIYTENANKLLGYSIREGLWLLQEAYENYSLALDQQNAKQVYDWYVSIASRISPFYSLNEKLEIAGFRKKSIREYEIPQYSDIKVCPLTKEAKKAVDDFFLGT